MRTKLCTEVVYCDVSVCCNLVHLTGIYAGETKRPEICALRKCIKGYDFQHCLLYEQGPMRVNIYHLNKNHSHKTLDIWN